MNVDRALALKKERLAELTTDELHSVAAAQEIRVSLTACIRTLRGCTTAVICPRKEED